LRSELFHRTLRGKKGSKGCLYPRGRSRIRDGVEEGDAFPNNLQALVAKNFRKLGASAVPKSTRTKPKQLYHFNYTLKFSTGGGGDPRGPPVTDTTKHQCFMQVKNLISMAHQARQDVFETAWEKQFRLCLGEQIAFGLKGQRSASCLDESTYRKLVSEGRIEFVTFHSRMSYEEFRRRALRPRTVRMKNLRLLRLIQAGDVGFRRGSKTGFQKDRPPPVC